MSFGGDGRLSSNGSVSPNVFEVSDSLDHALLESLFYNEMMFLEDGSSSTSSLFSTMTEPPPAFAAAANDPSTLVEKALLRDFGVTALSPAPTGPLVANPLANSSGNSAGVAVGASIPLPFVHQASGTYSGSNSSSSANAAVPSAGGVASYGGIATAPAAGMQTPAAKAPPPQALHQQQQPQRQLQQPPPMLSPFPEATPHSHPLIKKQVARPADAAAPIFARPPVSTARPPAAGVPLAPATSATAALPAIDTTSDAASIQNLDDEQKHNKLLNQFATLASRLGIGLPPQFLQSLSAAAANGTPISFPPAGLTTSASSPNLFSSLKESASSASLQVIDTSAMDSQSSLPTVLPTSSSSMSLPALSSSHLPPPARVQRLQSTAEEALAAASRKADNKHNLPYSKRRKKPRLDDCERELASLQAENEMLKRHLATVSKQSHNFDLERTEAEKKMRAMLEVGAAPQDLDVIVKDYTELYSDYGKRRHQELTFHLEQLQR
jgi:hypothetical protein